MAELEPICCRVCDKGMGSLHHGNCVYGGENVVRAGVCVNNPPRDVDFKAARAAVFPTANPLHFVRDGVPCEDQEAARQEFLRKHGYLNSQFGKFGLMPEYSEDFKRRFEASFKAEEFAVLGASPACPAGHKLNSVGKCSCDVTPLSLDAKAVRDAFMTVAKDRQPVFGMFHSIAKYASDEQLLKLWRLLR